MECVYKCFAIVTSGQVISTTDDYLPDSANIDEMNTLSIPADPLDRRLNNFYLKKVLIKLDRIFKGHTTSDTSTIYIGIGRGGGGYIFKAK